MIYSKKEEVKQFKATINKKLNKKKHQKEDADLQLKTAQEDLKNAENNKKTLEDQLKNTKEKGAQEVVKNQIDTITKQVTEITTVVTSYTTTVTIVVDDIAKLESGAAAKEKDGEVKALESEGASVCGAATKAIGDLPLVKSETEEGKEISPSQPSGSSGHPGVISGITIKGDIGTSTSTTTTSTDISTQIIEKQETAS